MTYNRSEIMKQAWSEAKGTFTRLGYARHQLHSLFVVALRKAWAAAKSAAQMGQRSAKQIGFDIMCLECKDRLTHADYLTLSDLRHAQSRAFAHEAAAMPLAA